MPQPVKRFSVSEYYELERAATYKSDFYEGEIFAMAGGTERHSRICTNVLTELGQRLKGRPCLPYESNLRLKVIANGLRTYPDVSVYCGALERDEEDSDGETYTNPTVLFEVLSRSTEGYDRGLKAAGYRRIETLKAYVLIWQNTPHVEMFERQADGSWLLREVSGLQATLSIPTINVQLPLADVYARVEFTAA